MTALRSWVGTYAGHICRQKLTFHTVLRSALAWLGFDREAESGVSGVRAASGEPAVSAAVLPAAVLPADLVEPVVAPRYGIDGWTYRGTVLEAFFPDDAETELASLTHAVCGGLATPWGYEQAARLLERYGAYGQAYAVVAAYETTSGNLDGSWSRRRARLAAAVLAHGTEERDW